MIANSQLESSADVNGMRWSTLIQRTAIAQLKLLSSIKCFPRVIKYSTFFLCAWEMDMVRIREKGKILSMSMFDCFIDYFFERRYDFLDRSQVKKNWAHKSNDKRFRNTNRFRSLWCPIFILTYPWVCVAHNLIDKVSCHIIKTVRQGCNVGSQHFLAAL